MSNVTVTVAVASSHIEALRHNVAEAVVRAYGAERAYGEALCSVLPAEWYLVEHSDKSEAAKVTASHTCGIPVFGSILLVFHDGDGHDQGFLDPAEAVAFDEVLEGEGQVFETVGRLWQLGVE